MQLPASNLHPDRFHRFIGNCGTEVDEELSLAILRSPGPKRVTQKIEFPVRVRPPPVIILAIDDLRLRRMKLQPTFQQSSGYRRPYFSGFLFRLAMHDGIIGVTFKWTLLIPFHQPSIKCIVQEQIR